MRRWPTTTISRICEPASRYEVPLPGRQYRQLGVRWWGEGAYERETIDGANTRYAQFNLIKPDDLLINKIWARHGSIAVATPELSGAYVSAEFPVYSLDLAQILPAWMRLLTKWRGLWRDCDEKAQGTSGKNRIKPAQFLSIEIPLPTLAEQQEIVARLDALADKTRELTAHLDAISECTGAMLLSLHHRLSNGRTVRLSDVIELHEDSVPVEAGHAYPQVGVRGFGGGLFAKAAVTAAETSYRAFNRLYQDAIVMSQVKGWEGALALVPNTLSGMFVSPEYRTFRCKPSKASPAYLGELIRTPWFWSLLQDATRGVGARRERTRPEQFLNIELPMPNLDDQERAMELLSRLTMLKARHSAIREANAALLPATLERLFAPADRTQ